MQQTGHPPQDAGINKATNVTLRVELIIRMLPFLVLKLLMVILCFGPSASLMPLNPFLSGATF